MFPYFLEKFFTRILGAKPHSFWIFVVYFPNPSLTSASMCWAAPTKTLSVIIIDRHEFSQNEGAFNVISSCVKAKFPGISTTFIQYPVKQLKAFNDDLDDPFAITKQDLLAYGKSSNQDFILLLKFQRIHDYYFRDMTASRYIASYETTARVLDVNGGSYVYTAVLPAKIRNTKDQPECFSIGWEMIAEQTMAAFTKDFKLVL